MKNLVDKQITDLYRPLVQLSSFLTRRR